MTPPAWSGTSAGTPPPTGPNEIWWAPYDPYQVPDGLAGATYKNGLLIRENRTEKFRTRLVQVAQFQVAFGAKVECNLVFPRRFAGKWLAFCLLPLTFLAP